MHWPRTSSLDQAILVFDVIKCILIIILVHCLWSSYLPLFLNSVGILIMHSSIFSRRELLDMPLSPLSVLASPVVPRPGCYPPSPTSPIRGLPHVRSLSTSWSSPSFYSVSWPSSPSTWNSPCQQAGSGR